VDGREEAVVLDGVVAEVDLAHAPEIALVPVDDDTGRHRGLAVGLV
jgi:hypothetical protein